MKKLILSLIILSFVSLSTFAQENWHSFSSETGKFSIDFSGDISESTRVKENSSTYKMTITNGEMNYMISVTKHQNDVETDSENLLSVSISSMVKSLSSEIISQQDVTRNGAPGVYADMIFQDGSVKLEYFVFMNGVYQYQVMAYAVKESYNQKDADRFFRGFEILD